MAELESQNQQASEAAEPVEEEGGLYGVDEIADAFLAGDEGGADTAENPAEPEPSADAAPAADTEAPVSAVMPEGWEDALWSTATPELQAHIAAREKAHADAMSAEKKAQADLKAQTDAWIRNSNAQMQQALASMQHVIEGEFASMTPQAWKNLANNDPAAYVKMQQLYQSRMDAVRQTEQAVAAQVQLMKQTKAEAEKQRMDAEYAAVLPQVKALIGASYDGKTFVNELAEYLVTQGVPRENLSNLSTGYEVMLAAKAMLYDRQAAKRAEALKKVAEAPAVQSPAGTKGQSENDKYKRAMSVLKKNPSSTDAIANVFLNL